MRSFFASVDQKIRCPKVGFEPETGIRGQILSVASWPKVLVPRNTMNDCLAEITW